MKLEFFPAAEQELLEAAKEYEGHLSGLGNDFLIEVERSLLCSASCRRSARSSIQFTVEFHFAGFHTHSFSVAMVTQFVSLRWRTPDADQGTGSRGCKIANKCF